MYRQADSSAFDDVDQVVAESLRFKAKLAIGENAYASLRMVNRARELWDVVGAAGTGAAVAKSTLVASTFFAPTGLLGALGIGAAATPIGWVAFAALASGGACYGVYRWLGDSKGSRVIEIPKFLNTPLDTLGLALFDLIAPLALRLAAVDGEIESAERTALVEHLVDEWGLDQTFVDRAIKLIEPDLMNGSPEEMAAEMSAFLHANPDCNHRTISAELGEFLRRMLEAGGPMSESEEQALAACLETLSSKPDNALSKAFLGARSHLVIAAEKVGGSVRDAAGWTQERLPTSEQLKVMASNTANQLQRSVKEAATWAEGRLPSAEQVQDAAKRSVRFAAASIRFIKKRVDR